MHTANLTIHDHRWSKCQKSLTIGTLMLGMIFPVHAVTIASFFSGAGDPNAAIDFVNEQGREGDFVEAGCQACVTASPPAPAGPYDFDISVFDSGPVTQAAPISGSGGLWSEALGGVGNFSLMSGGTNLVTGVVRDYWIFAKPGSSLAILELGITPASSTLFSLSPTAEYYVDIFGTTSAPVTISTASAIGHSFTSFDSFTLDWSATFATTPYQPTSVSAVPEPETALLLSVGLIGLIAKRKMRRG